MYYLEHKLNNDLVGKTFIDNNKEYLITEKFLNCKKEISPIIISHNNKHCSSIYYLDRIDNFQFYSYDLFIKNGMKSKYFYILCYDTDNEKVGVKKIGLYTNSSEFKKNMLEKIKTIRHKRKMRKK